MRYLLVISLLLASPASAESKRIEVYPLSQSYWDVRPGETLGEIVNRLIPANHYLQEKLMHEIMALNPDVFPDGGPDNMLANRRLWLPNGVGHPVNSTDASGYAVEHYQWGSIRYRE